MPDPESNFALRYDNQSDHPLEVAGMLNAMMPDKVRVLDVGCGTGSVTLLANGGRDNRIVAIEPCLERADKARSRGLRVYSQVLDDDFARTHGQFDVVMSSDVIEHTIDPVDFLHKIRASLRTSGTLLISVPNVAHWSVRFHLLFGKFNYETTGIMDETHLRWFTEATFRQLLATCGFEILQLQHTAGVELSVYCHGKLRRIPRVLRERMVYLGLRLWPRLFGAQLVVRARKTNL